jgi:hypothetical protein
MVSSGIKKPIEFVPRYLPFTMPINFPWESKTGLPLLPGWISILACQKGIRFAFLGGPLIRPAWMVPMRFTGHPME